MESKLQKDCNKWLRDKDIMFIHDEKGRGKGRRHRAGVPDIIIIKKPVIFIELKTATGKLSKEQLEYHHQLWELGFLVYTVKTIEEFIRTVENTYGRYRGK